MRRASPAAPTSSAAITISPAATSGSIAASIRFRGESPPDPQLDIHAQAQVQGLDAERHRRRHRPQARDHLRQHRRRCRRTSCCRGSCSGPRSPTCRRPKRCSSPPRSPRCSRGSGSLDPINALRKAVGLDRLRIVPADIATGQKTAIARRQVHHPQVVRGGRHRRPGLFRNARRISDDPLALDPVDRLDRRPPERERAGQQGLLALNVRFGWGSCD